MMKTLSILIIFLFEFNNILIFIKWFFFIDYKYYLKSLKFNKFIL